MKKIISLFGMNLPVQESAPPAGPAAGGDGQTAYRHDEAGRLVEARHPDGGRRTFEYDRQGNLVRQRSPGGRLLHFGYDDARRVRSITDDEGNTATYDFAPGHARFANPACQTEIALDGRGNPLRLAQTVLGAAARTEYSYDADGKCTAVRPAGSTQWLRYELDGQTRELRILAENGTPYARLDGRRTVFANGVREERLDDARGRIETIRLSLPGGQSPVELGYRFNDDWRIGRIGECRFAYDGGGRLLSHGDPAAGAVHYAYDRNGNRLARRSAEGETLYSYEGCDRLRTITLPGGGSIEYAHDRDGRRTARRADGRLTEYRYDAAGRLAEVWRDGALLARYAYDALGRRVLKIAGGAATHYHYDLNGQLLAETDGDGRARATYLWAGARCIGRIDGAVGEAAAEFYHTDHLGTAWAASGPDGALAWRQGPDPFGTAEGPVFARKFRDRETGFYDFGARLYDPESERFLTPDTHTWAADDWRLLFDPGRDFWGGRKSPRAALRRWQGEPQRQNRYLFCLNDPVNHTDLDGHSAWWYFLTIPSSLTWAMPNTVLAVILAVLNLLMEVLGWVLWPFISLGQGFHLTSYPWGQIAQKSADPPNPYDLADRDHFWLGLTASARLGVPWTLLNGSFFVWRPFTLGNVVFVSDIDQSGHEADRNSRFVVPKDPDVQLNRLQALYNHEMQHVFQYALLGPLFHALPIPPLLRLIDKEEDHWWKHLDLGGITWLAGGLVSLATGFAVKPETVQTAVNPATWWSTLLPYDWVKLVSKAWDLNNWTPGVGVYELSLVFQGGQSNSFLERNAGAHSGDVYQTVVEADKTTVYVGEFTRVVGADKVYQSTPASPSPASTVSFAIAPAINFPAGIMGPAAATLDPNAPPHQINLDKPNTPPVKVVNASGFYFHSLQAGKFTVTGTGSLSTAATESVEIEVKDIGVTVRTDVFVCEEQTLAVKGDPKASYSLRQKTINSGGGVVGSLGYKAGNTAGTDTLEVVAKYDAATYGVFKTYGDNAAPPAAPGLAGHDYVVKTIDINVKEPTITPDAVEVFAGGVVNFAIDHPPQSAASTTKVAGSQFNLAKKQFIAGKGPIAAQQTETVTLTYKCKTYTRDIKVKPITAAIAPATVDGGQDAQITVAGGVPPYRYEVSAANSKGAKVDAAGKYTAGSENAEVTDTVTVTDRGGDGGRARVEVKVRAMTARAEPASVKFGGKARVVAERGAAPYAYAITHRESTGSAVDAAGQYTAGTAPGSDTVTVTDKNGTRLTVAIAVTGP